MLHRPDVGLEQVLPSAAASLGVAGFDDALDLPDNAVVVVCLIDGLGAEAIEQHPDLFGSLADARGGSIEAAFPTTTPTGLTSLGTALRSGAHGIVGASFWLPEEEMVLAPLHWGHRPSPLAVQPETTVFEDVAAAGVRAITIAPSAYERSGLTGAALRGSQYQPAEDASERAACVREVVRGGEPSLVYLYWPALDRSAHEFGLRSSQWRDSAREVDALIGEVRAALPTGSTVIVTADHGMVDCDERMWIEDQPRLRTGVRVVAGEPRMRHVYIAAEHDPVDVARQWQEVLHDKARILTREDAIAADLFGAVEPDHVDRIGDFIAIAEGGFVLGSRTFDERVSLLRGHHGALTDAERRIPALVLNA